MIIIADRSRNTRAYLYHNIILVPGTLEVLGVVLGSCVFGKNGKIKGKFFHNKLYSTSGEILAMEAGPFNDTTVNVATVMEQGWEVITSIQDHTCPWVQPLERWSELGVVEFLKK